MKKKKNIRCYVLSCDQQMVLSEQNKHKLKIVVTLEIMDDTTAFQLSQLVGTTIEIPVKL